MRAAAPLDLVMTGTRPESAHIVARVLATSGDRRNVRTLCNQYGSYVTARTALPVCGRCARRENTEKLANVIEDHLAQFPSERRKALRDAASEVIAARKEEIAP